MITSTGNNRVRSVSALAKKAKIRREQGLFIVEGAKMFAEGQAEGDICFGELSEAAW